jgi:hypothetical protein
MALCFTCLPLLAGCTRDTSDRDNDVLVVSTATGARRKAFRPVTPAQQEVVQEFIRRGQAGTSRMELFTPAAWAPLPGPITGVIVGREVVPCTSQDWGTP